MESNAKSLVDHWSWAASKGVMNGNTAAGLKAACTQVFSVLDDWQNADINTLDIEDLLLRFQNLKKKDFKPQVLEVYKRRFRKAVESYKQYLRDPGGWKPVVQEKSPSPVRVAKSAKSSPTATVGSNSPAFGGIEYPFPLRPGIMAKLILPADLTGEDVRRLSGFMAMLVVDGVKPLETKVEASHES
jgi:hypothetical protein